MTRPRVVWALTRGERKTWRAHSTAFPWLLLMPPKRSQGTLSRVSASGKQVRVSPLWSPCPALRRSPQTAAFGGATKGLGLPHSSQDNLAKAVRLIQENKSLIFLFANQLGKKSLRKISASLSSDSQNILN